MTIFAIGITTIFALLSNTITAARSSQHEIIVAGLLREQIELVKNMRDTNIRNYIPWDSIPVQEDGSTTLTGGIYMIENNFLSSLVELDQQGHGTIVASPIYLKNITSQFQSLSTDESRFL